MHTRPLYLALILLSFHTFAKAQYAKCKDASGHITVQDTPCAADPGLSERKRPTPGEKYESFAQRKKDKRPDANWEVHAQAAPRIANENPVSPPSASPHTTPPPRASWQEKEREYQKQHLAHDQEEAKQQAQAGNQMMNCDHARQQLGVQKGGRPIYRYDNKGNRQYVDDNKRNAEISAAEQRVSRECS